MWVDLPNTLDLIVLSVTALAAVFAFLQGLRNQKKISELHVIVNSRLSELLKITGEAKHAEGVLEGRAPAAAAAAAAAPATT